MHGQETTHGRVGAPQLLTQQRVADEVHAGATISRINRPAQEAQFAHAPDQVLRKDALFVGLARDWRDLLFGEAARLGLDALLRRGQFKVHAALLYSITARPSISTSASS